MSFYGHENFPQVLGTLRERVNFNYSMFPAALCLIKANCHKNKL